MLADTNEIEGLAPIEVDMLHESLIINLL